MIDPTVLHRLRNGICAVGYLNEPLVDFTKHFEIAGRFQVVGTGFLVRKEIVMTNRHVIDDLEAAKRNPGVPDSQLFLVFVVPRQDGHVGITARQVRYAYSLRDRRIDVAFIEFKIVHPQDFRNIAPVVIDDPCSVRVSEKIAVFGYPHGNTLLEKDGRMSRWGPVLQQGWISGIAPYEGLGVPHEFLLDVRAAEGISGSPVFRPSTGRVCGVLHSGTMGDAITTTAFAQPVSQALLADWLAEFERNRDSPD